MKLSKLYCNDVRFKNISFNLTGLNVIYADVVTSLNDKKNSHDLGKTKLAELIDFLFIKQLNNNSFLIKAKDEVGVTVFQNHIFYLELLLSSGKYLTIRRSIASPSKTSFALNDQRVNDFNPPLEWINEDLGIKQAKTILGDFLALDFFLNKP